MRLNLRISGTVQGVGYRDAARHEAERLGLAGWVRNHKDGLVEAKVEGTAEAVQAFADWCWHGPPGAAVTKVEVRDEPDQGEIGFHVLR